MRISGGLMRRGKTHACVCGIEAALGAGGAHGAANLFWTSWDVETRERNFAPMTFFGNDVGSAHLEPINQSHDLEKVRVEAFADFFLRQV
jgi:hypothetical protein